MTNASCADCGRIVAFRTHDPSEISECRNCGTWVKRSAEMPGVAVSVKEAGTDTSPVTTQKATIPPRKDASPEPIEPTSNLQRSAPKAKEAPQRKTGRVLETSSGQSMSAAAVYAAIRDIQKLVYDLRSGQKELKANQERLLSAQNGFEQAHKALHDGQKALHSGQKQLFTQCEELKQGQATLLERTLEVPDMPVVSGAEAPRQVARNAFASPSAQFDDEPLLNSGFHTTPFSSLKIPIIPIKLEDLDVDPKFTEEGSTPKIPETERSDRLGLINEPLPEPPPYVEPVEPEIPHAGETSPALEQPDGSPALAEDSPAFKEAEFDDTAFETRPSTDFGSPKDEQADPFMETAAHDSPFTIEGPPSEPFTIAEEGESATTPTADSTTSGSGKSEDRPFVVNSPRPFGQQEYTHEPYNIGDPFAPAAGEEASSENYSEDGNPVTPVVPEIPIDDSVYEEAQQQTSPVEAFPGQDAEEDPFQEEEYSELSEQIAAAKEGLGDHEEGEQSVFDPSQEEFRDQGKQKSCLGTLFKAGLFGVAVVGGYFLLGKILGDKEKPTEEKKAKTPLIEFPKTANTLPLTDPQVTEATKVAELFIVAKTVGDASRVTLPVDSSLLKDFWEPLNTATIEKTFEPRILANGNVEVDFLIKDYGTPQRLLPLVKIGKAPFRVNWKNYRECEEVTLDGIAQGNLSLSSGKEIGDQGTIRTWLESGKSMTKDLTAPLGNFEAYRLHNFSEVTNALAVVRSGSPEHLKLAQALSTTQLKFKGQPSLRTILSVQRIEEGDPATKKPARLEIKKVIATEWPAAQGQTKKPPLKLLPTTDKRPKPQPRKICLLYTSPSPRD